MCIFKGVQGTQGTQGKIGIQGTQGISTDVTKFYVDASLHKRDILIETINDSLNNVINGDLLYYTIADVPLSPISPGNMYSLASDASYLYVCVEENKWKRILLNTW
jgi:hypothetical protein